jgi:hypothetical protein
MMMVMMTIKPFHYFVYRLPFSLKQLHACINGHRLLDFNLRGTWCPV